MNEDVVLRINRLAKNQAIETFQKLCGATQWCSTMETARPFRDSAHLKASADQVFDKLTELDWREAFDAHPKIGDTNSLRMKFAGNKQWSADEQSGMSVAADETIQALADYNRSYEIKFGYIFIVCATGRAANEMLAMLLTRMSNDPATELLIAAAEQRKITHLRIDKLLTNQA